MYNYSNYGKNEYMIPASMPNYQMASETAHNQTVTNPTEGFIRGNMFTDLYKPYLNVEPFHLTSQNEKEAMLNKIREFGFAALDLNLYLDNHPDDTEKINLYNQFLKQEKQAEEAYESKYGPLMLSSDALTSYPWAWLMPPWPWEVS